MNGDELGVAAGGTRRPSHRVVAALLMLLVMGGALAGIVVVRHRHTPAPVVTGPRFQGSDVHAPAGVRIKVEVLNATRMRGLGRRATLYLRDRGFDVVAFGTSPATRDTTLVIDRSGHPAYAQLVAQGLGGARVESHPDSSRYVDVSVLVGAGWRPPPQPFYP
jgi:LytR cell envelope-related transcriptional attenuator